MKEKMTLTTKTKKMMMMRKKRKCLMLKTLSSMISFMSKGSLLEKSCLSALLLKIRKERKNKYLRWLRWWRKIKSRGVQTPEIIQQLDQQWLVKVLIEQVLSAEMTVDHQQDQLHLSSLLKLLDILIKQLRTLLRSQTVQLVNKMILKLFKDHQILDFSNSLQAFQNKTKHHITIKTKTTTIQKEMFHLNLEVDQRSQELQLKVSKEIRTGVIKTCHNTNKFLHLNSLSRSKVKQWEMKRLWESMAKGSMSERKSIELHQKRKARDSTNQEQLMKSTWLNTTLKKDLFPLQPSIKINPSTFQTTRVTRTNHRC